MLIDVVIDTNIFLHLVDRRQPMRVHCDTFFDRLLHGATFLCVDEGFNLDESRNRSAIGSEYFDKIRFVNPAFEIIRALGNRGRIVQLSKQANPGVSKKINRLVPDKTDRVFIRVCWNSQSLKFVSHDFEDLPDAVRRQLRKAIGVESLTAQDAIVLF